jgi:hypothetical protein
VLSERDRAVLDIERAFWRHAGAKEAAVRERLGLSPARYYQVVNRLADDPAAVAAEPAVTARLRRLRTPRGRYPGNTWADI